MAYNNDFEEGLQDFLQDTVDTYLEGKDAVDENELADFITGKATDFAIEWAANHPEEILGKVFGEDVVKNSGIPASSITTAYDAADKIVDAIELGINIQTIIDGASAFYAVEGDYNARTEALGEITRGFLSVTKTAVEQIPVAGPVYSLVIGELQNAFDAGFNLVTRRVAQLQYTEVMCDYYAGNINISQLYSKVNEIHNLPDEYKKQISALLVIETKLNSEGVSTDNTSQSKKEQWVNKGNEIYNSMNEHLVYTK
ncbi:hypothetical protein [Globicatella sulfidifaciens]|uniref:Uncharacterized protein n=1 Tax=Globicatella sulfidifaciens TaxID=136093 RepID=A0A7X8C5I6_9LACT|nr:hypothetical protein [Globicatella sulfidifaciens]NLJ19065.1 hypothetical protein [Globicatella sulfidifaciens]